MKLSIAMCTYNGSSYVREQLGSIAAQTRLPDELIVCDDRSSDDTREIIEAFASESSFPVRLYTNERILGSTKNFEKAIGLCRGDIVALSDQDDIWYPEKLRRVEAVFSSASGAGLVFTDAEMVDENLYPMGYRLWQCVEFGQREQKLVEEGKAFDVLLRTNFVTGATMAFRSKFKELVLPIPDYVYLIHDGWIALLVSAVAGTAFVREPLIKYRQHPEQQLGAALSRTGLSEQLATARHTGSNAYLTTAETLKLVHKRLSLNSSKYNHNCKAALSRLEAKITHLHARANMPGPRALRVPFVFRELLKLRYHRYSNGMYSVAKDLLL